MNIGKIKKVGKKFALASGIYRPARFINDHLTNRVGLQRIKADQQAYSKLLKEDSLCFDIGANIGAKSLSMLGAGARVVAFEPQPGCVSEIEARCGKYGDRIRICNKAVGSSAGTLTLYTDEVHDNYASFHTDWEGDLRIEIVSEVITFDFAIATYGTPDYCKIDVEGWEFEVLSGLNKSIPLISFEYHLSDREVETTRKCIDRIAKLAPSHIRINIADPETTNFSFDEWLTEAEFHRIFPTDLLDSSELGYGDIWVRSF